MYATRYEFFVPTQEEIKLFYNGSRETVRHGKRCVLIPFHRDGKGNMEWLAECEWGDVIVVDTDSYASLQLTEALDLIYMVADAMNIPQLETYKDLEIFHAQKDTARVAKIFEAICEHCIRVHK